MNHVRRTRAKRLVMVQFKGRPVKAFQNCPDIYRVYSREQLGICLNALWNALSKKGKYNNKNVTVYYKSIDILKTLPWR